MSDTGLLAACTLVAVLSAGAAQAWDFTPGLPCVLRHKSGQAEIELTYDPTKPLYAVTVRREAPWSDHPVFAMRFDGAASLGISTDRHTLSRDGRSLTVEDTGFGNVLNGLQFNDTVTAILGDDTVQFSLAGAADPVADFRLCRAEPGA
ncbi:MAG: hypothetical protein AAF999_02515 [Pseudomonadota bacterium]